MNENRNESPARNDMTQRVYLDNATQTAPRSTPPQRKRNVKRWYMTKKEKITLISLGSVAAALLIVALVVFSLGSQTQDDGLILKGVLAAGVDLGGMTPEEAAFALEEATYGTYDKTDMIVKVLDTQITLSPKDTGAKLDIDAVVKAAYNYGRTGSRSERNQAKANAAQHSVVIPVTPYLNLDTQYIQGEIDKLGEKFSSSKEESVIKIVGKKAPKLGAGEQPNFNKEYQTLTVYAGVPEYGLDPSKLYKQVMDGYNTRIFTVVSTPSVESPAPIDQQLTEYYNEFCWEPVDAKIDAEGKITPEVYGYGFDLEEVKQQLATATAPIVIKMNYLTPTITEDTIINGLYKDIISSNDSALPTDEAWRNNVTIAAQKLNERTVYPGVTFSFNEFLSELTGLQEALAWQDRVQTQVLGGGVTQVASVLYISVLEAELEIVERHSHVYMPDFIAAGMDAYVDSTKDFAFRNNRPDPIRIKASVDGDILTISIEGVETRNYIVEVTVEITKDATTDESMKYGTLYNVMLPDNGYENGSVLVPGVNGCVLNVFKTQYPTATEDPNTQPFNTFITEDFYAPLDEIVVELRNPEPGPSDPGTPDVPVTPGVPDTPTTPDDPSIPLV